MILRRTGRKLRETHHPPVRWKQASQTQPRFGGAVFADAQFAFSNITKAVTWSCEEEEDGQCVKVLVVPSDKLDQDTAAAISAVSQGSTGALRIKMHNKLAALVVLGWSSA